MCAIKYANDSKTITNFRQCDTSQSDWRPMAVHH